jgi:hypothetical protein
VRHVLASERYFLFFKIQEAIASGRAANQMFGTGGREGHRAPMTRAALDVSVAGLDRHRAGHDAEQ